MARPKVNEPKEPYTVMLKPSLVNELEKLAEKAGISRSQFMANMIEIGYEDAKLLDKFGLIKAVTAGKKIINSLIETHKAKKV
jgi:metal-responsive CopG/Arc/MetJ family transcriptional regulator